MPSKDGFGIKVEADDLRKIGKILKEESDGKQLKKDLTKEFRQVLQPVRDEARAAIRSMPANGPTHSGMPMRATIARRTSVEVRYAGKNAGVRLVSRTNPKLRGFRSAAKATNKGSWRHKVFGGEWITQTGQKKWFDGPAWRNKPKYVRAVTKVLQDMKVRLIKRGH